MILKSLALFTQIVEKGSLRAAAHELGFSPATVSERLAALEAHYGVVLLNRTTRSIHLTDEGRLLFEGAKEILSNIEELDSQIRFGSETFSGHIRVSAPIDLGRRIIAKEINSFMQEFPAITIELLLSDGFVDIVNEGIDMAVRFGTIADSTLRARPLGQKRRVLCAAPDYLDKHGIPIKPADLREHNCLVMRFGTHLDNVWKFGATQMKQVVTVKGNRISNDGALIHEWGLSGHGIMLKSELDVSKEIADGRLTELLADYAAPPLPLQLVFPPSRSQPRRVKAFSDRLAQAFW